MNPSILTGGTPIVVSIVVAVYNAEKFIHKCVDSLLAQTYPHLEVILVDDGSPDRCGAICDEYAARDSRVKVCHQPNGGVAVARQTGIDHATGDYVIHADPDDWVEPNMVEELLANALETGADMVICDYIDEYGFRKINRAQPLPPHPTSSEMLHKLAAGSLHGSLWNKLIRRECIGEVKFREDVTYLEDLWFLMKLLHGGNVTKISYLPRAFYHYVYNLSSISKKLSPKIVHSEMVVLEWLTEMNIHDEDQFYSRKGDLLGNLFCTRDFSLLSVTYPEIHPRIIREHRGLHDLCVFAPLGPCLSLALRGWPRLAYCLYRLLMVPVRVKESVQRMLGLRK